MSLTSAILLIALCCAMQPTLSLAKAKHRPMADDGSGNRNSITRILETIREIILEGSEDFNLPVLDPFHVSIVNTSLSEARAYELTAGLHDVVATGLGAFEAKATPLVIPTVTPPLFMRLRVTADLRIPLLPTDGNYHFDALLGEVVHLYGRGRMRLRIEEVKAKIVANIYPGWSTSELRSLDTSIDVDNFDFELTGLLEGGLIDDIFTLAVKEAAKFIFNSQKSNLEKYINDILFTPLEKAVNEISFQDLVCSLVGICTGNNVDEENQLNNNIGGEYSRADRNTHH